jgi:hypothetical protein
MQLCFKSAGTDPAMHIILRMDSSA